MTVTATESQYASSVPAVADWVNESNATGSNASVYSTASILLGAPSPITTIAGAISNFTLTDFVSLDKVEVGVAISADVSGLTPYDLFIRVKYGSTYCAGHTLTGRTATGTPGLALVQCTHFTFTESGLQTNALGADVQVSNIPSSSGEFRLGYFKLYVTYQKATYPDDPTGTPSIDTNTASQITVDKSLMGGGDGGSAITYWKVQYATDSAFTLNVGESGDIAIATNTWTHSSLTKGDVWYYRIKWKNSIGYSVNWSASSNGTVEGVPDAPTLDSVTTTSSSQLQIAFTHNGSYGKTITNTRYRLNGGSWVEFGSTTSPQTISGLSSGTQYTVDIADYNAHGWSTDSNDISKYTKTSSPIISQFEPKSLQSATVSWNSTTGATSYKIEYRQNDGTWSTYATGVTQNESYPIEGLTNKAEVDIRITAVNPDGVEGDVSAESTIFTSEINFGVLDYKIMESSPLRQMVRVWVGGGTTQVDTYNRTQSKGGILWVLDILIEAGKKSIMIIPDFQYHNQFAIGLLASLFNHVGMTVGVIGFSDIKTSDVDGLLEKNNPQEPIVIMMDKVSGLVVGIGANRGDVVYAQDDTNNVFLQNVALTDFKDRRNEDYYFTVFTNRYYDPSGNELVLFKEGESFTGISGSTSDAGSSGGYYGYANSGITPYWTVGTLKKGTYIFMARIKRSAYGRNQLVIKKDASSIESYGRNSGSVDDTFYTNTSYEIVSIEFNVDSETSTYKIELGAYSGDADVLHIDYGLIIPMSNNMDFVYDLYRQGLTTNKPKYIGLL